MVSGRGVSGGPHLTRALARDPDQFSKSRADQGLFGRLLQRRLQERLLKLGTCFCQERLLGSRDRVNNGRLREDGEKRKTEENRGKTGEKRSEETRDRVNIGGRS